LPPTDENVNTSVDYVDQQILHEQEISDNKIYIDYNQYRIDVSPRMLTAKKLGDEDINAYFDVYILIAQTMKSLKISQILMSMSALTKVILCQWIQMKLVIDKS